MVDADSMRSAILYSYGVMEPPEISTEKRLFFLKRLAFHMVIRSHTNPQTKCQFCLSATTVICSVCLSRTSSLALIPLFLSDSMRRLAATAKENALDYARSTRASITGIRADSLKTLKDAGLRYIHDTIAEKAVQVRLYINDPGLFTKDTLVSGYVKGTAVDRTRSFFEKWFANTIRAVHFDQPGMWEQPVRVAARVDLTDMDASSLFLYGYDREANKYKLLASQVYKFDEKGYIHFITEFAGDVIVSEGPLLKHGAPPTGSTLYSLARPSITEITSLGNVTPLALNPLSIAAAPQPAAVLTAPTELPSGEKTDYSLERWLSRALLFSSLLAATVLWVILPHKNDKYVTVEEYRKNNHS